MKPQQQKRYEYIKKVTSEFSRFLQDNNGVIIDHGEEWFGPFQEERGEFYLSDGSARWILFGSERSLNDDSIIYESKKEVDCLLNELNVYQRKRLEWRKSK